MQTFQSIQDEFDDLRAKEQDLKSAYYHVVSVSVDESLFRIILFYDPELRDFSHTVINEADIELQFKSVPRQVILVAAELFSKLDSWKCGESEYPFVDAEFQHIRNPFAQPENYFTSDHDIDDDELDIN